MASSNPLGLDFNAVPGIKTQAESSVVVPHQAPKTNTALQLADALGEIYQPARRAAIVYAQKQQEKAEAQAKTDALKSMGADFAEAVRQGLIEPTQSPWYMDA